MGRSLLLAVLLALGLPAWGAAKIDPNLRGFIQGEGRNAHVAVLAMMDWQQTPQVPQVYQTAAVLDYLRWQAGQGWQKVSNYLQSGYSDSQNHVQPEHLFFLNNSFTAAVTVEGLRRLSQSPGVSKIYLNYEFNLEEPFPSPDYTVDLAQMRYNFRMIGQDRLIREFPDVDGRGVIIGAIDSGADGNHTDLKGKIPFMYYSDRDQIGSPRDIMYHGTHVSGIIVGGDRSQRHIGIAPRATLTVASSSNLEQALLSMHFMLDTDGNPATYYDIPRAVNSSWSSLSAGDPFRGPGFQESGLCPAGSLMPDQEPFYRALSAWEAAGILPVFSAGNCGPGLQTITPPKEHPSTITVGAIGLDGRVLVDSSRGPAVFQGRNVFKPDIVAPGQDILSTVPGGRHQKMSGTSMAAPHVTGAIALIAQVNPRLTPADIKDILLRTALPRNRDGGMGTYGQWTPEYGYGVLQTFEAVKMAMGWGRQQVTGNILGLGAGLFWPFSISLKKTVESAPVRPVRYLDEAMDYPEELEGTTWLDPKDLW